MQLINGDCLEEMDKLIAEGVKVDLTVTSPPYDNLRTYNGNNDLWSEDVWKGCIERLYKITRDGGVVVWVVGDATINGSETGTSFKQALYAMECGFNLHDTMIYRKLNPVPGEVGKRQQQCFEYMFVFSSGKIKTHNPIFVDCKLYGKVKPVKSGRQFRQKDGTMKPAGGYKYNKPKKYKHNIWEYNLSGSRKHPAAFPEQLASDHITAWSNEGDTVLDCFMGSGTTGVACKNLDRDFIGIELDENYFNMAKERIENTVVQGELVS